ncbi:glutaredoxin family protein [Salinimonas profundi]
MLDNEEMLIELYTAPACSLCQKALTMIRSMDTPPQVTLVNVRDDTTLYHEYGARIPVLKRTDTQQELGWPFDQQALKRFLE